MYPWESVIHKSVSRVESESARSALTLDEIARLSSMRARYDGRPEYLELGLDERKLTFARWLVTQGKLTDDRQVTSS
jgi:hypothetical protein